MKFREFIQILLDNGFELDRQRGSHRIYAGKVRGKTRLVGVAGHGGADILPGTLASMIRSSGLPKKLFR